MLQEAGVWRMRRIICKILPSFVPKPSFSTCQKYNWTYIPVKCSANKLLPLCVYVDVEHVPIHLTRPLSSTLAPHNRRHHQHCHPRYRCCHCRGFCMHRVTLHFGWDRQKLFIFHSACAAILHQTRFACSVCWMDLSLWQSCAENVLICLQLEQTHTHSTYAAYNYMFVSNWWICMKSYWRLSQNYNIAGRQIYAQSKITALALSKLLL